MRLTSADDEAVESRLQEGEQGQRGGRHVLRGGHGPAEHRAREHRHRAQHHHARVQVEPVLGAPRGVRQSALATNYDNPRLVGRFLFPTPVLFLPNY